MIAALAKLLDGLERRSTWKNAAVAVGCIGLVNLVMGRYILPTIEARRPEALEDGFLVMIDLRPLASVEEVYRVFDLYQPDILGLVRLLYALDFVTPLAFAVGLMCLLGKLLRYLGVTEGWRAALLLPFVALVFDCMENGLCLFLISRYQDGQVFPGLARVAGVVTAGKFIGLAATGLMLVVLLLRAAVKRVGRSAGGPRRA